MRTLKTLLVLCLVAACAATATAQEKKKKKAQQPQAINQLLKKTEALGLSEEQTKKVKEIVDSYAPKYRELNAKLVLTEEQKKARADAVAKNKTDGLKGKQANEAIQAALALTDEQKKAQTEMQTGLKELNQKLNEEVLAVLTPEQKEKFKPAKKPKA